jgi:hypothetical protein
MKEPLSEGTASYLIEDANNTNISDNGFEN